MKEPSARDVTGLWSLLKLVALIFPSKTTLGVLIKFSSITCPCDNNEVDLISHVLKAWEVKLTNSIVVLV